jgi:hypothetical protein
MASARRLCGWGRRPFARRVEAREDRRKPGRNLGPRHARGKLWRIARPQHQHVEAGEHGLEVVVVEDRVGQPPEVVERAERLADLFVEAIADFLRRRV